MSKLILLDQFHIVVLVPQDLPRPEARRIARLLRRGRFRRRLASRVRAAFRGFPELDSVRVRLST
jgi:hypothetical protein